MNHRRTPFQIFLESQKTVRLRKCKKVRSTEPTFRNHSDTSKMPKLNKQQSNSHLLTNFQQQAQDKRSMSHQNSNKDPHKMFIRNKTVKSVPARRLVKLHDTSHIKQCVQTIEQTESPPRSTKESPMFKPLLNKRTNAMYERIAYYSNQDRLTIRHPGLSIYQMHPWFREQTEQRQLTTVNTEQVRQPLNQTEADEDYYKLSSFYETKYSPKQRIKDQRLQRRQANPKNLLWVEPIEPWVNMQDQQL